MVNHQKPMFSEDGGHRPLLTPEELRDACIHTAATIVVAFVYGCEFGDCRLNDNGYKWPTSISRIELMSADDWWIEEAFAARTAIHEAGSMAVAKHLGRGPHLIIMFTEHSETAKLLDNPNVWKAIEALARFIEDNYQREGYYGALGTGFEDPSEDSAAIKLLKSMDLPSLVYA
jgi:hypothetical protein